MQGIVFQHNSRQIADLINKRGTAALAGVDRAMGAGAHELARDAQLHMPKFRSRTVTATGVEHPGLMEWRVRFATRWAQYTEEGSGPGGRPSLKEMLDWIRLKNITPRTPGMSVTSLAALFRKSIAKRGVSAQPFAAPALQRARPRLMELIGGAVDAAIEGPAP